MFSKGMDPNVERELVCEARNSPAAFEKLFRHYYPIIFQYAFRRVRNERDAEDITAATFEKALKGIGTFKWTGVPFGAWLYRIAGNNIADHYRRRSKNVEISTDFEALGCRGEADINWHAIDREDLSSEISRFMKELPLSYQEVLALKFGEGMANEEIARILKCKKGNVAVKVFRAIKAIRKIMEREGFDWHEE